MTSLALADAVRQKLDASPRGEGVSAALAAVLRHFGADMGMIHRLDPADRRLVLIATGDGVPEPVLAAARRIPLGKGIAGETALTGKPVSMCNLQTDTSGVARPGAKATGAKGRSACPSSSAIRSWGPSAWASGGSARTEAEPAGLLAAGRVLAGSLGQGGT